MHWRVRVGLITLMSAVAAGFPLYPTAADWFINRDLADLDLAHSQIVASLDENARHGLLQAADEHNREIADGLIEWADPPPDWYFDFLRVTPSSVMSRVTIPAIDQSIIVFHGTADEVLYQGAGHQFGTSLPVGGESTHSVITAHSGLSSAVFFSRLPELRLGDQFTVTTMGRTKWYEVDRLEVVVPGEYRDYLEVVPGRDLVTLFTCYPVAINSHRLLVRGTRIDPPEPFDAQYVEFLAAGFPWWAVMFSSAVIGGTGLGRWRFKPNTKPAANCTPRHRAATKTRNYESQTLGTTQ